MDLMAEKDPSFRQYFALVNKDTELAIDVKGIYPEVTKYVRDHNIKDVELLTQKQFAKQLKTSEYFKEYTAVKFNGYLKRAYKLNLEKLKEKIELRKIDNPKYYSYQSPQIF